MEIQNYFSMWRDSIIRTPLLFSCFIIFTLIFLGLFFWLVKVQKRNNQKRGLSNQQTDKSEDAKMPITITRIIENCKPVEPIKKVDKLSEVKTEISKQELITPISKVEIIKLEKEEQPKEKYIGYNPINIFAQTEPLNYPYVIMPKANCVIKFPRKGRVGRKGFKEEGFKVYIEKYFRNEFNVFDDRFMLVKNSKKPYEPDFTLINEKRGINIFLDIEIDEPYEGLNDIAKRKSTHFQHSDTNRNNSFASRGWIVIRFAEMQVHQDPNACCNFVADVLKSIDPNFLTPNGLSGSSQLKPLKQWTKVEADEWSSQNYREQYLGITNFGFTSESQIIEELEETELGDMIEKKVIEVPEIILPIVSEGKLVNSKIDFIKKLILSNQYLSFIYQGKSTITKPVKVTELQLTAFCYVKNIEMTFLLSEILNLLSKSNYNTLKIDGPTIGLDRISNVINISIKHNRFLRIKYTKAPWFRYKKDIETGELILDKSEAVTSVRTIMNVQLLKDSEVAKDLWFTPNERHITAYCNMREEDRMFRFDRISEIEILDI